MKHQSIREIFKIDKMKVIWTKAGMEGRCDGVMHYIWNPNLDHIELDGRCSCKKEANPYPSK